MPGRSGGERLAIDPNRNSTLYFGARSGNGLWRSTNFGESWSRVTSFPVAGTYVEDPSNSYTGDIVGVVWVTFDRRTGTPGNTTQTIYVGVADTGNSVYRSTDGGATWAAVRGSPRASCLITAFWRRTGCFISPTATAQARMTAKKATSGDTTRRARRGRISAPCLLRA